MHILPYAELAYSIPSRYVSLEPLSRAFHDLTNTKFSVLHFVNKTYSPH